MDLLAGGGVGHILLGAATHVELVDLSQELLWLWWMCGGGVVCHTVQPAMPEEEEKVAVLNIAFKLILSFHSLFWGVFVFDDIEDMFLSICQESTVEFNSLSPLQTFFLL